LNRSQWPGTTGLDGFGINGLNNGWGWGGNYGGCSSGLWGSNCSGNSARCFRDNFGRVICTTSRPRPVPILY